MRANHPIVVLGLYLISGPIGLWAQKPAITEYLIPTAASSPSGIVLGPDGNLWVVETASNKIAKITGDGIVTEYSVPTENSQPTSIAAGPDGNLWFTEASGNKIGQISIAGTITEYTVPTGGSLPMSIAAGPDGNLWFTENSGNKIGKITPGGTFAEFSLVGVSLPTGIVSGPDGNLWFTESATDRIGRITPAGLITEYPLVPTFNAQSGFGPSSIARGPDGKLWFTATDTIWSITTSGTVAEYLVPTGGSGPAGIATGPDGNLWFTERNANKIGRLTTDGVFTEFSIPTAASSPVGITPGPDGNIWFTESTGNRVAKIDVSTVPANNVLSVAPSSLTFTTFAGGAAPPSQTLTVSSSTPTPFTATASVVISFGLPWLTIVPSGNLTTNRTMTVSVNPTGMGTYGTYLGNITLTAGNVTQTVAVTLIITAPPKVGDISVSPAALSYTYFTQSGVPNPQQLIVSSATKGVQSVPITISTTYVSPLGGKWLVVPIGSNLTSGSSIYVGVQPEGLSPGTYSATVTITPTGGTAVTVPVALTVKASSTTVVVTPASLSFVWQQGDLPDPQLLQVTQSGPAVQFSAEANAGSLQVTPRFGTGSASLTVSVPAIDWSIGSFTDRIVITLSTQPLVFISVNVTMKVLPAQSQFQEYPLSGSPGPTSITRGPDGNLWFTERQSRKIGKITSNGTVTEYSVPSGGAGLAGITSGPDGALWFTEASGIGRITTSGAVTGYPLTSASPVPEAIVRGSDDNLWFTERDAKRIGRITARGELTEYSIPTGNGQPGFIAAGSDGNLWFTEPFANKIGKIAVTGAITEYAIPTPSALPTGITGGPDGNLWFTENGTGKIARITTSGSVTEYTNYQMSDLQSIVQGPDGNLWFTESNGNRIGKITTGGVITEYRVPTTSSWPTGIVPGADGNIWFTETLGNKIGKFTLSSNTPTISSIVNAASFADGPVSPGEVVTIAGTTLGPSVPSGLTLDSSGQVATTLSGVSVFFNGNKAPLIYVGATQINCVVPYELAGQTADVLAQVEYSGRSNAFPLKLTAVAPAIFTRNGSGTGTGAIANAAGGYNGPDNPAPRGSTITIYLTGEGQTRPGGVTGKVTAANPISSGLLTPQPVLPLSVTIGGKPAAVTFFGEAPGVVSGVLQINAQIPDGLSIGDLPLVVSVGGINSQEGVTVSVR